jgi:hypothetical protein
MSTGLCEDGHALFENETRVFVLQKIRTIESKLRSLKNWFVSKKKKKMRSIEKCRSPVDALRSQIIKEDERHFLACARLEEKHDRNNGITETVALLKLRQKLAKKEFDFDRMKKKYEMKVIRQCFLLRHYQLQLYMHEAYIYAEGDRSSIAEGDSSSSCDSEILEERVPKRAKKELEAAGPQNAENISPPLEDAAATQSPASPSPGNVAVCGQV